MEQSEASASTSEIEVVEKEAPAGGSDDHKTDHTIFGKLWSSIVEWLQYLEDHLADMFGLNESKYQWAIDARLQEDEMERKKEALRAEGAQRLAQQQRENEDAQMHGMEMQELAAPSAP